MKIFKVGFTSATIYLYINFIFHIVAELVLVKCLSTDSNPLFDRDVSLLLSFILGESGFLIRRKQCGRVLFNGMNLVNDSPLSSFSSRNWVLFSTASVIYIYIYIYIYLILTDFGNNWKILKP